MSKIRLDAILPNPEQPRKHFDVAEMESLKISILEHGVINAISVEEAGKNYILHDGERRVRAARLAGLLEIPATIEPALNGTGMQERLTRALVANVQRTDMDPIEEANVYQRMRDEFGWNNNEIHRRTGIERVKIDNLLLLLRTEPEIQELIRSRKFTKDANTIRAILKIPDSQARIRLVKGLAERKTTVNGCQLAAKRLVEVLAEKDWILNKTPAMELARQKSRLEEDIPKRWNAMMELNVVPAWGILSKVAFDTCAECELRAMASHAICGRCQLVDMLRRLMEAAK